MLTIKKLENEQIKEGTIADLATKKPIWLDAEKPSKEELQTIAQATKIPEQELQEFLSPNKRPMIFDIDGYSIIIFRSPLLLKDHASTKPIVFLVSKDKNDFISIHRIPSDSLRRVKNYPEFHLKNIIKQGVTSLFFTIIDEIIASYFHTLDEVDEEISKIEETLTRHKPSQRIMHEIYQVKKTLIFFHRALVANRDVVSAIEKDYLQNLDRKLLTKFNFLYADLVQLIELETTYRDILTSSLEVHLTEVSNYLNIVIKKITSWGAIILVPSLIASIFGMNFKYIPEANEPLGFFGALLLMSVSVIILLYYFRKKDWI